MAEDRGPHAPREVGGDSEVEAEDRGEDAVYRFEVKDSERDGRQPDGRWRTQAGLEAALEESAAQQLLGNPGRDSETEQCERESASADVPQLLVECGEHALFAQIAQGEQAVECEAQAERADDEQAEQGGGEASRPQAETDAQGRRREPRSADGHQRDEDLESQGGEDQLVGGVRFAEGAGAESGCGDEGCDRRADACAARVHAATVQRMRAPLIRPPTRCRVRPSCYPREVSSSSLAPTLLVAMPQLLDPNFRRTVVLLVHHDEGGTFGVVLNRSTDISAPNLCESLEIEWRGSPDDGIDWGGPVDPQTGWVIFDDDERIQASEAVTPVGDGVHFAGSLEVLRQVANDPPRHLRVLLGYAGWGPGQLEAELTEGAWLVVPVTPEVVFEVDPSVMWEHVVRSLGIEPATLVATRGVH